MTIDRFNIKQIEVFSAVMSAGGISSAARLLQYSQPKVTRLIQDLEASLGFELFQRSGTKIMPTQRALAFHHEVEGLLISLRRLEEKADAIKTSTGATLEIVATPALSVSIVSPALAAIGRELPNRIYLSSYAVEQAIEAVLSRSVDLGVVSFPVEHSGLDAHWIAEAPCVAAVPASDPLAKLDVIPLALMAGRRVVVGSAPHRHRGHIDKALSDSGVEVVDLMETSSSITALLAAKAGLGVAIVEPSTAFGVPIEGLAIRPVDAKIPFYFGVVTPISRPMSRNTQILIEKLWQVAVATIPGLEFTKRPAEKQAQRRNIRARA